MGEYLIIDGYNVINAWKDFAQLRQENLEHARELLVAGVAEYAAFKSSFRFKARLGTCSRSAISFLVL